MELDLNTSADGGRNDTVKQTIVETVEVPRLNDKGTSDFVKFKIAREAYERIINEKNLDPNVEIPLTRYKSSIPKPMQQLFVLAGWIRLTRSKMFCRST